MTFVQRVAWALVIVGLAAPLAVAGPNAGGVLVVHSTSLTYTSDTDSYIGQSGVACGQDGPQLPLSPVCPPYDPEQPCNVGATNPTSAQPNDAPQIWFVLAAFPSTSCPRLKAVGFGIMYDEARVVVSDYGLDDTNAFEITGPSIIDGRPWPAPGSETGWSFGYPLPLGPSTSQLQELYWFAGYSYAGTGDAFFEVTQHSVSANRRWIDDSTPPLEDPVVGYGKLGFGGTAGVNPNPVTSYACCIDAVCFVHTLEECTAAGGFSIGNYWCDPGTPDDIECVIPVEETSWGRVKHEYGR